MRVSKLAVAAVALVVSLKAAEIRSIQPDRRRFLVHSGFSGLKTVVLAPNSARRRAASLP